MPDSPGTTSFDLHPSNPRNVSHPDGAERSDSVSSAAGAAPADPADGPDAAPLAVARQPRPVALVTGASSGIGRSLATQLTLRGCDVVVVADDDAVHEVADVLAAADGDSTAVPVEVDLATPEGVQSLLRRLDELDRPVEVAALNAGVTVGGRFDESAVEDHLRLVDLNCRSTVHLARHLVRSMRDRQSGRMLLTASTTVAAPVPFQSTYAASKAFVQAFAQALHHELEGTGVTVTSLLPGPTDTDIFRRGGIDDTALATRVHHDDPDDVARDALDGLYAGRAKVVTGPLPQRVGVAAARLLPERAKALVSRWLVRPGSGRAARDGTARKQTTDRPLEESR